MRILKANRAVRLTPLAIIEVIIAFSTFASGIHVVSPILDITAAAHGPSVLLSVLGSPVGILIFSGIVLFSALLMFAGLLFGRGRWLSAGLFISALCRFYTVMLTWLVVGFLPLSWIVGLTVACITIVCWYFVNRGEGVR